MELLNTRRLLKLLYPPTCFLCEERLEIYRDTGLCARCGEIISEAQRARCVRCGLELSRCRCADPYPGIERSLSLAEYTPGGDTEINRLIYTLKHENDIRLQEFFGIYLARALLSHIQSRNAEPRDFIITHVPRSAEAIRKYGFDQSKALAAFCSKHSGVGHLPLVARTRGGQLREQKTLGREERKDAADNAYAASARYGPSGRTVVIIDDIVTTGATVCAVSDRLENAKAVVVLSVARSVGRQ